MIKLRAKKGSIITVNGKVVSGDLEGNISINEMDISDKEITINITGDVHFLEVQACDDITVTGSVGHIKTVSGDVICHKDVQSINTVSGDVSASKVELANTVSGDILNVGQ